MGDVVDAAYALPTPSVPPDYTSSKILFVSNNLGSSVFRINAISAVSIASYALFAAGVRLLAEGNGQSEANVVGQIRSLYHRRQSDVWAQAKVLALEFGIFVVPLLLSVTLLSGTGAAVLLNGALLAAAAYLFMRARSLERTSGRRSDKLKGNAKEDGDDAASFASGGRQGVQDGTMELRRRRQGTDHLPNSNGVVSRRNRSYESSDEEELEVEAIERRQIQRQRKLQARQSVFSTRSPTESPMLRVSVESAAEQAWHAAANANGRGSGDDAQSSNQGLGVGLNESSTSGDGYNRLQSRKSASTASEPTDRPSSTPFLTVYRSHMMLITIVCILAVDFPVFDRVLGKCETWGTSLMDLGVGSFVFSLGVVSAGPFLTPRKQRPRLATMAIKDARKALPLFALGLIRVITVKATGYPEHVSEYGVHWNFFLTLAVLPLLKTAVEGARRIVGGRWSTWGFVTAALHQIVLTTTPLQGWVLGDTPRETSLLAANREGITSLPGYLAILLLAIDLGMYILPARDPYQAFRQVGIDSSSSSSSDNDEGGGGGEDKSDDRNPPPPRLTTHTRRTSDGNIDIRHDVRVESKQLASLTAILASWSILYWAAYYGGSAVAAAVASASSTRTWPGLTTLTSRRLANFPYVLWVAAFNATFLLAYAGVYWALLLPVKSKAHGATQPAAGGPLAATPQHLRGKHLDDDDDDAQHYSDSPYGAATSSLLQSLSPSPPSPPLTPPLFTLINRHAFTLFLLSNVLTGCVNLSIRTMYAGDVLAFAVLVVYVGIALGAVAVWDVVRAASAASTRG